MSDYEQGFNFSGPQFLHPFSEDVNQTVYKALSVFFKPIIPKINFVYISGLPISLGLTLKAKTVLKALDWLGKGSNICISLLLLLF